MSAERDFTYDNDYDLKAYTLGWGPQIPEVEQANVRSLLTEPRCNFVKAPGEVRNALAEALKWQAEKSWMEKEIKAPDRSKAPIVFLPDQENFAWAPVDWGPVSKVVATRKVFDQAEWVVEIPGKSLDLNESKAVYVLGRIQGPNDLFNLMITAQRLKEIGYQEITLITPCLGWTRQDKPDQRLGQPNTTASILKVLGTVIDRLVTLKNHSVEAARGALGSSLPCCDISAYRDLLDVFLEENLKLVKEKGKLVIIGPDKGAETETTKAAAYLSKRLGYEVTVVSFEKERDPETGKLIFKQLTEEQLGLLEDKIGLILDDVIGTASTTDNLRKLALVSDEDWSQRDRKRIGGIKGAERIVMLSTHASLQGKALERLSHRGFLEVIFTDSRDFFTQPYAGWNIKVVSCLPLLKRFIDQDRRGCFNPWQDSEFKDIVC